MTDVLAIAATAIIALFAGLRFETGQDFYAYGNILAASPTIREWICGIPHPLPFEVEPGYAWFNILLKSLGLGIQELFLIVSVTSMGTLYYVGRELNRNAIFLMLLAYLGFGLLIGQMSVMRQTIAYTFLMIGLLLAIRKRTKSGFLCGALAPLFQVSSVLQVPIPGMASIRLNHFLAASIVLGGLACLMLDYDPFRLVISAFSEVKIPLITSKLEIYANIVKLPQSFATKWVLLMQIVILFALFTAPMPSRLVNVSIWITLSMIISMTYLAGSPAFWNRLLIVAIPFQVLALAEPRFVGGRTRKAALICTVAIISSASLTYTLRKPELASFVPYNSTIGVALTGNRGDGLDRQLEYLRSYNEKNPVATEIVKRLAEAHQQTTPNIPSIPEADMASTPEPVTEPNLSRSGKESEAELRPRAKPGPKSSSFCN